MLSLSINELDEKFCAGWAVFGPGTTRHNPAQRADSAPLGSEMCAGSFPCAGLCRVVPGPKTGDSAQFFDAKLLILCE